MRKQAPEDGRHPGGVIRCEIRYLPLLAFRFAFGKMRNSVR